MNKEKSSKTENPNWEEFESLINADSKKIDSILSRAQTIKQKNFGNTLKVYIPGRKFPAISITGDNCELNCEHCNRKYLKGMKPITNSKNLEAFLMEHHRNGGIGALISGGSLSNGSVPLFNYLDTIKKVKNKTGLIINTHTGLVDERTAQKLADVGVDIISFDVNMDKEIIEDIYHLDKDLEDYKKAIQLLEQFKLNIVPHICIGLHYGNLNKELESLKYIKESKIKPSLIVLIALIPPNRLNKRFKTPSASDIAKVIAITRLVFPKTEISLGCMRPRKKTRYSLEMKALRAGITRIEMPLKKVLSSFKEKNPHINYQFFSACCAVPERYEKYIKMEEKELNRRYKNLIKNIE